MKQNNYTQVEIECERNNITPRLFFAYCMQQYTKKTGLDKSYFGYDYTDFSQGKDCGWKCKDNDCGILIEDSMGSYKPFDLHTYIKYKFKDGTPDYVQNIIMEFEYGDDKTGHGYFYYYDTEGKVIA